MDWLQHMLMCMKCTLGMVNINIWVLNNVIYNWKLVVHYQLIIEFDENRNLVIYNEIQSWQLWFWFVKTISLNENWAKWIIIIWFDKSDLINKIASLFRIQNILEQSENDKTTLNQHQISSLLMLQQVI